MTEMQNPYAASEVSLDTNVNRRKLTELADIARAQRFLIWLLLFSIVTVTIPASAIIFAVLMAAGIWRLWRALNYAFAPLGALLGLLPVINWITILILNRRAITQLRDHGISVGFMGVSRKRIESMENDHLRKIGAI